MASEHLGMEPTTESPVDINDRNPELGLEAARAKLKENNLEESEENVFIVAACADKGIKYLLGDAELGVRYKESEQAKEAEKKEQETVAAGAAQPAAAAAGPEAYNVTVNGKQYFVEVEPAADGEGVQVKQYQEKQNTGGGTAVAQEEGTTVYAPMPGNVVRVLVETGAEVNEGDSILVLESMKMESTVPASASGTVREVHVAEGDKVDTDQPVATLS